MLHYGLLSSYLGPTTSYISQPSPTFISSISRYVSTHPIRIDTADIDVFRARPIRTSTTCVQREIHRNRSVVRLTSTRNGTPPPRSPGARLVEKFRIKDPRTAEMMLHTEESSTKNCAINQESECKINDNVSVPIVDSCDKCETVIVPLKKNRANNNNYNQVTISLKNNRNKSKSNAVNDNAQTCVNIKLRKHFPHKPKNNLNEEILLNSGEECERKLITSNDEESPELDRTSSIVKGGDSERVGTSVEILPTLPHSLNKSTNNVPQQTEQKPSTCFRQNVDNEACFQYQESDNKHSTIEEEKLKNCSFNEKEARKNFKLEKVGPKQGKKLKISEVSTDLDDIERCVKIEVNRVDAANNNDLVSRTDVLLINNNNNTDCLIATKIIVEPEQTKSELERKSITNVSQNSAASSTKPPNITEPPNQVNIKVKENKFEVNNNYKTGKATAKKLIHSEKVNDVNRYPCTSSSELLRNSQSSISSQITEQALTTTSILSESIDSAKTRPENTFKSLTEEVCSSLSAITTQLQHDRTSKCTLNNEIQTSNSETVGTSESESRNKSQKSESEQVRPASSAVDVINSLNSNQDQKSSKNLQSKCSLASKQTNSVCDGQKSESEQVRPASCAVDSLNSNQDQKSSKNLQNKQTISDLDTKLNAKGEGENNKLIKGKVKKKKVSKGPSKKKVAGSKKKQPNNTDTKKDAGNKPGVLLDEEEFEDEGLGKDCSVKTSDGSSSLDSDWEQVEIEEMEGGVKKKKLIVRKKGTKVTVTPLELKPPAIVENEAKRGQIIRQLSQKRVSLVDEDLGFLDVRKMSITDEIIVEQAAVFDDMISKELKTSDRRKSSLGLPALELTKPETEEESSSTVQDRRREIWKNKLRSSGKTLGKFYKPVVELESSDSSDEDGECDVNCHRKCQRLMPNLCGVNHKLVAEALSKLKKSRRSRRSSITCSSSSSALDQDGTVSTSLSSISLRNSSDSDSFTEGATGRVTPPAKTLPKFRTYCINDFQFLKVLGKGSFGKVLLAELKGSECYYAVKCLKKDVVLEDDDVECTMIERKVLALGTGHPYFCHLFCTFQTQSHLFFVMEYLNGGDLMFHIQQSGRFDEGRARFYAAEIVCGLTFLHKWGIVYRDLKLDNILLDFDGHVRIADFGMCKLQIYLDKTTDTFCGTPDYMAPEIIKGLKYNQCVDWWSFGILLYEMLVGQSPFSGCDEDDLFWSICNMRPHFPRHLSNQAKSILNAFLEKDWTKRLGSSENSASDVMNHEFFSGLKWHLLERRQLEPPFKPNMRHPLDTKYFDRAFTSEKPVLTPVDPSILESMDQTQFQGFSYTNPNATE